MKKLFNFFKKIFISNPNKWMVEMRDKSNLNKIKSMQMGEQGQQQIKNYLK